MIERQRQRGGRAGHHLAVHDEGARRDHAERERHARAGRQDRACRPRCRRSRCCDTAIVAVARRSAGASDPARAASARRRDLGGELADPRRPASRTTGTNSPRSVSTAMPTCDRLPHPRCASSRQAAFSERVVGHDRRRARPRPRGSGDTSSSRSERVQRGAVDRPERRDLRDRRLPLEVLGDRAAASAARLGRALPAARARRRPAPPAAARTSSLGDRDRRARSPCDGRAGRPPRSLASLRTGGRRSRPVWSSARASSRPRSASAHRLLGDVERHERRPDRDVRRPRPRAASRRVPANGDGISTAAFAVSTSTSGWFSVTVVALGRRATRRSRPPPGLRRGPASTNTRSAISRPPSARAPRRSGRRSGGSRSSSDGRRVRRVPAGHARDRGGEGVERELHHARRDLGAHPERARRLVDHHHAAGLLRAPREQVLVERRERAQVDHPRADALVRRGPSAASSARATIAPYATTVHVVARRAGPGPRRSPARRRRARPPPSPSTAPSARARRPGRGRRSRAAAAGRRPGARTARPPSGPRCGRSRSRGSRRGAPCP